VFLLDYVLCCHCQANKLIHVPFRSDFCKSQDHIQGCLGQMPLYPPMEMLLPGSETMAQPFNSSTAVSTTTQNLLVK